MIKQLFEDSYTDYDAKLKLKKFNEYLSKMGANEKKYLKCFVAKANDTMAVYNVVDVRGSASIKDGTADKTDDKKTVKIIISAKSDSKTMTFKEFAAACKKASDGLKKVPADQVEVSMCEDGKDKDMKFRFFYDDEINFAVLIHGMGTKAALEGLNKLDTDDLMSYVNVPVSKQKEIKFDVSALKKF